MKLFGRRKATQVRKKREASRESRTILRLASLRSRRMLRGCLVGEKAFSLSPMVPLGDGGRNRGEKMRSGKYGTRMKPVMPSKDGGTVIGKRGICCTIQRLSLQVSCMYPLVLDTLCRVKIERKDGGEEKEKKVAVICEMGQREIDDTYGHVSLPPPLIIENCPQKADELFPA